MTDSELSWKHHVTLSVTKLIDRLKQLLNWGITFHGIFFWFISCTYSSLFMVSVHGATFHGPTSVTYLFCRNVHCIWFIFLDREAMQWLFFLESNCLPLPSLHRRTGDFLSGGGGGGKPFAQKNSYKLPKFLQNRRTETRAIRCNNIGRTNRWKWLDTVFQGQYLWSFFWA